MSVRYFDTDARRARLAIRHRLLPDVRDDDVTAIARDLVALHSSDPVTVYLSAMNRMSHPSRDPVESALYDARTLVRHHSVRRTLWVAPRETTRRLHVTSTRRLVAPERKRMLGLLRDSGVDDGETWLRDARAHVLRELGDGTLTARELGTRVPELGLKLTMSRGKPYEARIGAHTRVLLALGFDGTLVRTRPIGTWINAEYRWASTTAWLGESLDGPDEREAARDLTRDWLWTFGPATTTDLAWWTGWPLRVVRRALSDTEAVEVRTDDGPAWVAPGDEAVPERPGPWVALLPSLDPTTMGWKERGWYLPADAADAFDSNGNGGPTIWVDGRIVGAWARRKDGEIRLHWCVDVPSNRVRRAEREAERVGDWLAETPFTPRFPGGIHARLYG